MKAEIIPTGTEILLGNVIDTNSSFLANQLSLLGIDLYFISIVGDNRERLLEVLKRAWTRAELIITTGGLGPTQGDITREAIAELVSEKLEVDQKLWQELQSFFRQRHREIPQSNIKQAMVIPSAKTISNSMGTAPGWWVEKNNHIIIALPGPPGEMQLMWKECILARLRGKVAGGVIISRTMKTFRLAEAKVDELLAPFLHLSNPTLATYAKSDGIHLRITAKAQEETEAKQMIAQREADIRAILEPNIWGVDDDTLDSVVGMLLRDKGLSLATMESFTNGLLCNTIADSQGSSAYFKGGLIACCDETKIAFGVDPQLLKRYDNEGSQVAEAMAEAVRKKLKADVGLSITGSTNDSKKGSNVFIGLNSDKLRQIVTHITYGDRPRIMQRAVYSALFDLRRILLEEV
jgi:nicotinamide-nucleotide amidase